VSPPVNRDLVVVGAGIVGASVAYHAARAGAAVTLVDAGRPGAGVTADSFAWIGAVGVRTGSAAGLRATATDEYRRLEADLPGLPVTWSGSLSWAVGDSAPNAGPGQEIVDEARVATLEPTLRQPSKWAVWAPSDGAVDPVGVTERLVAGARAHGLRYIWTLPSPRFAGMPRVGLSGSRRLQDPSPGRLLCSRPEWPPPRWAHRSAYASQSTLRRRRSFASAPRPV
jgi:glycine/D-amino acid oxidase-like deaminating enzyme